MITRRSALRGIGLLSLLAGGHWPGCLGAEGGTAAGETFRFHILNDLHHAAPECDPWFARVVARLREDGDHEFALLLGDLTDTAKPGSFAAVKEAFSRIHRPFHVQIGNHDQLAGGDAGAYEAAFPDRRNYAFEHRGWQFVGIDSTQGTDSSDTKVSERTLAWLDGNVGRLDRRRPVVLFTHFPLGKGARMAPLNADDVLGRFLGLNLRGVFGGHYHAQTETAFHGTPVVTGRCCARVRGNHDGSKEKGWWSVTAADGRLTRTFVEFAKA